MRFGFDLDKTICTPIESSQSSAGIIEAKPYEYMVKVMKELKNAGHIIVIFTHRSSIYCEKKTMQWLRNNDIPYDEVIFDKPQFDLVIDDKAIPPHNFISAKYVIQYAEFIRGWNFEKGSQISKNKEEIK